MNTKTQALLQEIRRKVKNPITGTYEFANDEAVLNLAVLILYQQLKQKRML
jgi:hypothetical protein